MRIWLITVGEPVPVGEGKNDRVLRTGCLAKVLADRGNQVIWWTSAFNHFKKKHIFSESTTVPIGANLNVRFLKARGYRRNLSVARFLDHREVARRLSFEIEKMESPDVILVSLPTVDLALAAVRYARRRRVPVIVDLRDMWPDIFMAHTPPLLRPVMRLALVPLFREAREACASATAMIGITDEFLAWGLRRSARSKTSLDGVFPLAYVTEQPAEPALRDAEAFWDRLNVRRDGPLIACFVGTMNAQYDLGGILRAAFALGQSDERIRFVLCGIGDRLESYKKAAAGAQNVLFPGWLTYAQIYALLRRAHVGLDPVPERFDYLASVNNKAIEYFSAGLPVISSPNRGVLASLLAQQDCGVSYADGDAASLARILIELAKNRDRLARMGENGCRLFETSYRADRVYAAFAEYLEDVGRRALS